MLKRIFQTLIAFSLFFAAKASVASPTAVTTLETCVGAPASCTRTFSENDQELVFSANGHLKLSGILDAPITGSYVGVTPFSSPIGVNVDGFTGIKIKFESNTDEGISSSTTNKTGPSIYSSLGSSIKTLELNSGAINSTDTAVFLTSSDSAGTDIIVKNGAYIQGARHGIRWDKDFEITQSATNSFASEELAEEGVIGNLTLRVANEGIIAANPRLINQPDDIGVGASSAFYSTFNSRVKSNVAITNEATGKIYGGITLGRKIAFNTSTDSYLNYSYINSEVSITNRGLISSHQIISDFSTKLTLVNEAGGIIRIEESPIAGSNNVAEDAPITTDIFKIYEDTDFATNAGAQYIKDYNTADTTITDTVPTWLAALNIRPQGDNSVITNYGTIVGNILSVGKTHTINLNGGTIVGNLTFAGTLNFNNDFSSSAMIGNISTRTDRREGTSTARINIGTKTYNISSGGASSDGTSLDGSLSMLAGTGGNPIISTTFTNDGAIGRLNFDGKTTIDSGVRLNINIGENYSYLKSGVDYLVIDGDYQNTRITTSDVNTVADSSISINDGTMGVNKIGVLTIHSAARDLISDTGKYKDLVVYIERLSAEELTDDETAKKVYETIGEIESGATGKLKEFQKYVDTNQDLTKTVEALKSAAPITDGDIELATMVPIHKMIGTANNRMNLFVGTEAEKDSKENDKDSSEAETLRFCLSLASQQNKDLKINNEEACGCLDSDITSLKLKLAQNEKSRKPEKDNKPEAIWGEAFGALAKRSSATDTNYNANTYGFTFGYDKKTEKDTLVGASISYAKSDIDLTNKLRGVEIHTYQANLYRSKFYKNNRFWNALAGIAFNEYSSNRTISAVNAIATAKYSGINYIGHLKGGIVYNKVRGSNFNFIPEISSTYVRRNTDSYTEKGADTLNLQVRNRSNDYLEGRVGYNINYDHALKKTDLKYRFHNSYAYNFLNKKSDTVANFVGQNNSFVIQSKEDAALSIRLGLGIDARRTEATTVSLDYAVDLMSKFISHTGFIKLAHKF